MNDGKQIDELHHEEWPGFRVVFYIVFLLGIAYLAYIAFSTSGGH